MPIKFLNDSFIDGDVQFGAYGSGSITGTTAYNLAVDSSGNIIENSANTRSVFVATSVDTTTNINATTTIQWNSEDIKDSGYTHSDGTNPDQITITQAGTYKIYAAITYTTTVQRANVALQILVNDVATGARGAGGYVRSSNNHNDGTTIVEDYVTVSANDVIKIQTSQEAANGTVNLRSGESKIIIEKLTGLTLSTTDANTLGGLGAADFVQSDSFPAGNNTEIQFNNNGQLGASSNFTFDGTNLTVGDVLINKTDSTSGVLTINTNRSFGREFTITNNGQTPLISADNTLTLEAQAGESQIVLTGGGSDDRVQIGKNGTYPFYFGVGGTNTGRLGIGTTSPSEKLNVDGNILATGTVLGSNLSGTNTGDQVLPTDFVSAANGGTFNGDLTVNSDFFVTGSAFEINAGVVTDFGGNTLSSIGTPLSGNDATTKTYVDNALAGKLSTTGKAADSNLLDGINSTSFLRSDVSATNSVDLRAPIFYDSNNTGYYLDPASTGVALKINGIINQDFQSSNLNTAWTAPGSSFSQGFIVGRYQGGTANQPHHNDNANWFANIYSHASGGTASYGLQLAGSNASSGENSLSLRTVSNGTFSAWRRIYHEGHKPTYSELGTMAYSNLTGTPTIPTDFVSAANGGTFGGNLTINGNLYLGDQVRIGDDAWIEDFNVANAIKIKGNQNNANGYIAFGSQNDLLGRAGTGALTWAGNTIWTSGNDGSGSGLDADLLDGKHATDFVAVTGDTMTGTLNINKSGSSQIAVNNRAYFGTHYTSTDVWIYGGPGDNIYLGGGIGNIQNDVYVGNGDLIVSNGDVGIGETSPDAKLDVNGAGNFDGGTVESGVDTHTDVGISIAKGKFIKSNDGNYLRNLIGQTTSGVIEIGQTGTSLISDIRLKPGTSGNIIFQGSGSEDMRINSSGNVGIGTTSPGVNLQVGNGTVDDAARVYYSDNTYAEVRGYGMQFSRGASYLRPTTDKNKTLNIGNDGLTWNEVRVNTNNFTIERDASTFVKVNSSGNVGIGTTSPGVKLDVNGRFRVQDNGDISLDVNTNGAFQIGDVAEVGGGAFIAGDNTDIDIVADGGPIVTFKNNGRVGIGTTGPGAMLDVDGSFKLSDFASISVATTGSLSPNQNYQASTQDTLADLTVDPSGNVVRGMQEGTWTFTKAQLDGNLGMTLIAAPGTNKAVIVYESSWMIKYNSTGAISANQKYEIRQASNTGIGIITVLPGAKINEILSNGQTMPGGGASAYGFYSRDVPADAGGRTFKTNTATTLHKNVSNQLPGGVQTVSIKLRYRIYDATTF